MKRLINLLPEKRKKGLRMKTFNRFIFKIGLILVLAVIIFILFLGSNLFVLNIYEKINQAEISGEEKNEINEVIQKSKQEIDSQFSASKKYVASFRQRTSYWDYLNQINQFLPDEVYLTKIVATENEISLKGLAKNRNDLVGFKNSLESVEFFKEVDMPISNFTSQTDVNFEITINLSEK